MNQNELMQYMEQSIEQLVADVLKSTIKNPKETAFLIKYGLAGKKAAAIRKQYEQNGTHIPAFMIASIISECNLNCTGCYARANSSCSDQEERELLSEERWTDLFREAAEIGVSFILLAGGEPLLRKGVIEQAAKIKNIVFPVFTNGTLIDDSYLKFFYDNRNLIPVLSVEGNEGNTDDRRGEGIFSLVTEQMDALQQKKLLYACSVTVTTENLEEVYSQTFVEYMQGKGCRIIFYVEYVPAEKGTEHLAPAEKERTQAAKRIDILRKEYPQMIFIAFPGDEVFTGGCLAAGRGFFHINPYGDAEPCPFSPYSDSSVKEDGLLGALRSPLFEKLREMELVGGEHDGGCTLFAHEEEVKWLAAMKKGKR